MAINTIENINKAIAACEAKKVTQQNDLKLHFKLIVESYKPKNILKEAYKNATENGRAGELLLKAAGGIGAGVLGGKLLAGGSLIGKIANTAISAGAIDGLINNKDKILAWGKAIYNNVLKRK